MFVSIKDLIPKAAGKFKITRQLDAAYICEKYRQTAKLLLPAEITEKTSPRCFINKVLVVNVADSICAQEIFMRKFQIIDEINKELGKKMVTDMRTMIIAKNDNY